MFYYLVCALGICCILKHGSIAEDIRTILTIIVPSGDELIKCSLCLGFWCGVFITLFDYIFGEFTHQMILFPFASSGFCWAIESFIYFILGLDKIYVDKKIKE